MQKVKCACANTRYIYLYALQIQFRKRENKFYYERDSIERKTVKTSVESEVQKRARTHTLALEAVTFKKHRPAT